METNLNQKKAAKEFAYWWKDKGYIYSDSVENNLRKVAVLSYLK